MTTKQQVNIFWFRRDLRLDDNHGLYKALKDGLPVIPVFIFDKDILDELPEDDHRVSFIYDRLQEMRNELQEKWDSSIDFRYGTPEKIWKELLSDYDVKSVFTNHDYEPYAKKRDKEIKELLEKEDIEFYTFKDQVIFEKDEVVKDDGGPYVVYTPYKNKWREKFNSERDLKTYDVGRYGQNFYQNTRLPQISLSDMGFTRSDIKAPSYTLTDNLMGDYADTRDFPAEEGTSKLSTYLRFGLVSVRKIMKQAYEGPGYTFMNELVWREFFMQILWHFPYTKDQAFREKYDAIAWRNNEEEFEKWKEGKTGYPIVDAGMRELNETGYMHNRVRMIVASFLTKHLLIDWRWGERYFAEKLFDYEMASNVGNWQWTAGSGVDAQPYFRVFNPHTQFEKFDKNQEYVRKWVPEYFGVGYVSEMVDHKEARERAIETYKHSLNEYEKNN
ncbi:MAG: DNA photolyase family protein [Candidatus Pacebacteria bacterium]|nr:DNA photolyase family protein [Candidatus Paceibacterota bacterium]